MKPKYYLRGLGVGVVLTAVIMGVVLGRGTSRMSDEEVIKRAKQLGMVEAESTLSSLSEATKIPEETDDTASDQKVDKAGEEVSEEVNQGESQTGESVPEVDEAAKENEQAGENSESIESEEDVKLASNAAAENALTDVIETEGKQEDAATEKSEAEAAKPVATEGSSDVNYVVVVLPSGSESDTCARILRESGVIDDGVAFNKYLVSSGQDRKIRSGTKQIPRGASFEEIASIITK